MAITTNSKILASDVSGKVDTAGTGLSKSGTTLSLKASGVTAGSYGPSANASPAHGKTFSVPYLTVDTYGRLTACSTKTITLPAAGASAATDYVTEYKNDSTTKYRKWKSGFKEVWMRIVGGSTAYTLPISFTTEPNGTYGTVTTCHIHEDITCTTTTVKMEGVCYNTQSFDVYISGY